MKLQIIKVALDEGKLPMLQKDRDETVQEYMKLKEGSLKKLINLHE